MIMADLRALTQSVKPYGERRMEESHGSGWRTMTMYSRHCSDMPRLASVQVARGRNAQGGRCFQMPSQTPAACGAASRPQRLSDCSAALLFGGRVTWFSRTAVRWATHAVPPLGASVT